MRRLVKDGVSGCKYPINTNPNLTVLLTSTLPDKDDTTRKEVATQKTARQAESNKAIRAVVLLKMKQGLHIRARHHDTTSFAMPQNRKSGVPLMEGDAEEV